MARHAPKADLLTHGAEDTISMCACVLIRVNQDGHMAVSSLVIMGNLIRRDRIDLETENIFSVLIKSVGESAGSSVA